jgi:hypothetical protein
LHKLLLLLLLIFILLTNFISLHTHSFNVDLRGDIDRQMAAAEAAAMKEGRMAPEGQSSATAPKHTWWWRLAHVSASGAEQHAAVQGAF